MLIQKNVTNIKLGIENVLKSQRKQKKLINKSNKIVEEYDWEKCV